MPLVPPTDADFQGPVFSNYLKSAMPGSWSARMDLKRASKLPDWKQELAFAIATQSCHAEHLGMCTAAQLVLEAPTAQLRYAFAAAAQDEATHSEILGRYVLSRGGQLQGPNAHHELMENPLLAGNISYVERAILHCFLEGFALDQFKSFVRAFAGDPLADIYGNIRHDEARHVSLGFLAVSQRRQASRPRRRHDLDRIDILARSLGRIGDDLFEWLAMIESTSIKSVRQRYTRNHNRRVVRIREAMAGASNQSLLAPTL